MTLAAASAPAQPAVRRIAQKKNPSFPVIHARTLREMLDDAPRSHRRNRPCSVSARRSRSAASQRPMRPARRAAREALSEITEPPSGQRYQPSALRT